MSWRPLLRSKLRLRSKFVRHKRSSALKKQKPSLWKSSLRTNKNNFACFEVSLLKARPGLKYYASG